jgi:hypothetical protein
MQTKFKSVSTKRKICEEYVCLLRSSPGTQGAVFPRCKSGSIKRGLEILRWKGREEERHRLTRRRYSDVMYTKNESTQREGSGDAKKSSRCPGRTRSASVRASGSRMRSRGVRLSSGRTGARPLGGRGGRQGDRGVRAWRKGAFCGLKMNANNFFFSGSKIHNEDTLTFFNGVLREVKVSSSPEDSSSDKNENEGSMKAASVVKVTDHQNPYFQRHAFRQQQVEHQHQNGCERNPRRPQRVQARHLTVGKASG